MKTFGCCRFESCHVLYKKCCRASGSMFELCNWNLFLHVLKRFWIKSSIFFITGSYNSSQSKIPNVHNNLPENWIKVATQTITIKNGHKHLSFRIPTSNAGEKFSGGCKRFLPMSDEWRMQELADGEGTKEWGKRSLFVGDIKGIQMLIPSHDTAWLAVAPASRRPCAGWRSVARLAVKKRRGAMERLAVGRGGGPAGRLKVRLHRACYWSVPCRIQSNQTMKHATDSCNLHLHRPVPLICSHVIKH